MTFDVFKKRYRDYADGYRLADGTLIEPMQRKLEHTLEVVGIAERICRSCAFSEETELVCRTAALFHDVARFEQVKRHHSFNDAACGFDHGHEGVKILYAREMLAELTPEQALAVVSAVELHNKAKVDYERFAPDFRTPVRLVRDADKAAILRLLTDYITGTLKIEDTSIFLLEKADSPDLTPDVVNAVLEGRPVLHRQLKTVNDFKLSLLGWCMDFGFAETARIVRENDYYGKILRSLPERPEVRAIQEKTMERLECLSSKLQN